MPTYDYLCADCDKKFESFHAMSEHAESCPICGGKKIKRLISAGIGVIFKGPGFYENDYKRKKSPPPSPEN